MGRIAFLILGLAVVALAFALIQENAKTSEEDKRATSTPRVPVTKASKREGDLLLQTTRVLSCTDVYVEKAVEITEGTTIRVDAAVLDYLKFPEHRTGFHRAEDWIIHLSAERAPVLVGFVSERIDGPQLSRDARSIVKQL